MKATKKLYLIIIVLYFLKSTAGKKLLLKNLKNFLFMTIFKLRKQLDQTLVSLCNINICYNFLYVPMNIINALFD